MFCMIDRWNDGGGVPLFADKMRTLAACLAAAAWELSKTPAALLLSLPRTPQHPMTHHSLSVLR